MKSIYKNFNDIEVDIEKINSIDVKLDEVAKKRIKNNIKRSIKVENRKYRFKAGVIAAATCLFLLVSAMASQHSFAAFADNIPVLNTLFQKFGLGYGGNFQNYTQVIGDVKKDKEYEVKLDEVVMDDYSFKLIYTIKCPEKISDLINQKGNPFPHTPSKVIRLNGKNFVGGAGGTDRVIDDYTIQVIEDYDINELNIPQNFDISIDFKEINNIKGEWKFDFYVSKEKISKDIKTFSPNKKLQIQNSSGKEVTLTFEKISFSPISTAILIEANNEFEYGNLIFKDEDGNVIVPNGSSLESHNGPFGYKATGLYKFEPMSKIPNKILVEYKNKATTKSNQIELFLKK